MTFALLTLLAAFAVAGVSEWFSVVGIMAIYAGAPFNAALIMGVVLGCAKLVTTSWLYRNWQLASWRLKLPLIYFTLALMSASSMGVFGFLTKSHLEQGAATVNNSAQIERLDEQINREKSIITDNEKVIGQLDATINSFIGKDNTDRALSVRRSQAPQRKQLRNEIAASQKLIDTYSEEKLKLTSQVRAVQLEVGPIKYIADLFYSSGVSDTTRIESAIRMFTLLIVSTLDPLAIVLLIAANHTILRLQNENKQKIKNKESVNEDRAVTLPTSPDNVYSEEIDDEYFKRGREIASRIDVDTNTEKLPDETVQVDKSTIIENSEESVLEKVIDQPIDSPDILPSSFSIDENDNDKLRHDLDTTEKSEIIAPPIIRSPSVSRIDFIPSKLDEDISNEKLLQQSSNVQTAPWAHQSGVLAEIIGNRPNITSQKVDKVLEKQIDNIDNAADSIEITDKDTKLESNLEVTSSSDQSGKYPKALSWLKEFKGD